MIVDRLMVLALGMGLSITAGLAIQAFLIKRLNSPLLHDILKVLFVLGTFLNRCRLVVAQLVEATLEIVVLDILNEQLQIALRAAIDEGKDSQQQGKEHRSSGFPGTCMDESRAHDLTSLMDAVVLRTALQLMKRHVASEVLGPTQK